MKLVAALAILALVASGLYLFAAPATDAGPPTTTAPPAPKTRAQIASEAYAIEASVKAIAGRKTDPSNDGTPGSSIYAAKSGTCYADSYLSIFVPANGCDNSDSAHWEVVNLTG